MLGVSVIHGVSSRHESLVLLFGLAKFDGDGFLVDFQLFLVVSSSETGANVFDLVDCISSFGFKLTTVDHYLRTS